MGPLPLFLLCLPLHCLRPRAVIAQATDALRAEVRANPEPVVGGLGVGGRVGYMTHFLKRCGRGRRVVKGQTGTRLRFISRRRCGPTGAGYHLFGSAIAAIGRPAGVDCTGEAIG